MKISKISQQKYALFSTDMRSIVITITFLALGVNSQQLGTDNVTYVNGITTLDISKSIPTALLVTGTVIFQVRYFSIN